MSIGPITIFDKSALESLNPDEACLFGHFYRVNLTPLFFTETLADLEKEVAAGRTPEHVVGSLAYRTQSMTADANVHHRQICVAELLGESVPIDRGVPVLAGGRPVQVKDKKGIVYDHGPEADALGRWQRGEFEEIERRHAKAWRSMLAALDLEKTYQAFRPFVEQLGKPRSMSDAKKMTDDILGDPQRAELMLGWALDALRIPTELWGTVFKRWQGAGKAPLPAWSPYAAHVASVELFFSIALGSDLISKERASNKADIAYLFYLPFCMVFVSNDRLHLKTVRPFLRPDQEFVWGGDLKEEMRRLDARYSALPSETLEQGMMVFASRPPEDSSFLTSRLFDKFLPSWRSSNKSSVPKESAEEVMRQIKQAEDAPQGEQVDLDDAAFVLFKRRIPLRMGKWRFAPAGSENTSPENTTHEEG